MKTLTLRHTMAILVVVALIGTALGAALNFKQLRVNNHLSSRLLSNVKLARAAGLPDMMTDDIRADISFALLIGPEASEAEIWLNGLILLVGVGALSLVAAWFSRSLMRQLGGEPQEAVKLAQAVAAGQLNNHIAVRPGDRSRMATLTAMQDSLQSVVSQVGETSNHLFSAVGVATASAQMTSGNHDLSGRTEQQASTLERTASCMEELNATVEAARAGEQGRGFAVVASEVRSLASRSADAAKQIKQLIMQSVERVEHGSTQVDQAGTTMSEVVASIKRVNDLMSEISAASREQATGVRQVGEAVSQMDRSTQQNAALVEEMAAAASSLHSQSQDLVKAVAAFKV